MCTPSGIALEHLPLVALIGVPVALATTTTLFFEEIDVPITALKSKCAMFLKPCLPRSSFL